MCHQRFIHVKYSVTLLTIIVVKQRCTLTLKHYNTLIHENHDHSGSDLVVSDLSFVHFLTHSQPHILFIICMYLHKNNKYIMKAAIKQS